jgi:DNA modification methylase
MADPTTRITVLAWWAHHGAATAREVVEHFQAHPSDLPADDVRALDPRKLRVWKHRYGLPPVESASPSESPVSSGSRVVEPERANPQVDGPNPSGPAPAAAVWLPISMLEPWARNPRINDHVVQKVAASLVVFGFGAPAVLWGSCDRLVAGHTRLKAVRFLQEHRPVWSSEGGKVHAWEPRPASDPYHVVSGYHSDGSPVLAPSPDAIPVRRMEFRDQAHADAYAIADNKLAEGADWDDTELAQLLAELEESDIAGELLGFDEEELRALMAELEGGDGEPAEPSDEAPAVQEQFDSEPGRVYALGPHRLACGDSTDPDVWDALLLDGEEIQVVWTDPPYGIAVVGGSRALSPEERRKKGGLEIENDALDPDQLREFLRKSLSVCLDRCKPGAAWYVASPGGPLLYEFATVLKEFEIWRWTLLWVKDRFVMGRADYHHRHEPIFYGWKPGAAHYFIDDRTQDTIFEVPRPGVNKDHPTMKPIELVRRQLANSSKPGWIVGEPFGGSGTTMMAAQALRLKARLIELDPRYCDVIRRRWWAYCTENGIDPGPDALEPPEPS